MRIDIAMTNEHKLSVASWWATSPSYALAAITKHLEAAQSLWPEELGKLGIGVIVEKSAPQTPLPDHQSDIASHDNGSSPQI